MAIRIECPHEGWENLWIDYKETGWTFGKRKAIADAPSDADTLLGIAGFIEDWHMLAEDKTPIPWDPKKGIELFLEIDDRIVIPWIISSWFAARSTKVNPSKN